MLHALASHLANLLNHVVHTGFPLAWSHHIIHSIQQIEPQLGSHNYRMIMVLEALCDDSQYEAL